MNSYFGKNVFQPFDTYEDALEVGLQVGLKIVISRIHKKQKTRTVLKDEKETDIQGKN